MGWEWHNRTRSSKGRFEVLSEARRKTARLMVRLSPEQLDRIRSRAAARFEDMTEYLLGLVDADLQHAGIPGVGSEIVRTRRTDTDGGLPMAEQYVDEYFEEEEDGVLDFGDVCAKKCPTCGEKAGIFMRQDGYRVYFQAVCMHCGRAANSVDMVRFDANGKVEHICLTPREYAEAFWNCMPEFS